MVVLGGSLVVSDKPDFDWNTPTDFLTSHLKTTFGNDWFENELSKPISERHIVVRWCTEGRFTALFLNPLIEQITAFETGLCYHDRH